MRIQLASLIVAALVVACQTIPIKKHSDADGGAETASTTSETQSSADAVASADVPKAEAVVAETAVPCMDKDGDKFCDQASTPDCNDNDASVYPGATEKCDGKDNNCNGVKDEGCTAPSATVSVKVTYPNSQARVLNVQVWSDKSQLGGWWDKSVTDASSVLNADLGLLEGTVCGLRINVSEGNPVLSWLCEGNGSTATIKASAAIEVKWGSTTYSKSDLKTWSAPGGTNSGCSALLQVKTTGPCAL